MVVNRIVATVAGCTVGLGVGMAFPALADTSDPGIATCARVESQSKVKCDLRVDDPTRVVVVRVYYRGEWLLTDRLWPIEWASDE